MMERGRPYFGGPYPIIEGHIPSMPVAKSSTKQADPIGALHRFVHERRDAEIPRRVPTRWPPPMPMKGTPVTNPNKTLIAALLDRSGSMETSKKATEDGWRELVNEQRQQPGQCQVTLAQFDTVYEVLYSATDIAEVPEFVVQPRGMTALLDATGKFITEIGEQLSALPEAERPGHVICLIMTDGMENSSHEWDWDGVKRLIKQQRDQWNWKFIFLGANIDAVEVGGRMGFAAGDSITYDDSSYASTTAAMGSTRAMITSTRAGRAAAFSEEDRNAAMGTRKKARNTTK